MTTARHRSINAVHAAKVEGAKLPLRLVPADGGWHVEDQAGRVMSQLGVPIWRAEELRDTLTRAAQRKLRRCLCCGEEFLSEGPHNRLCGCHGGLHEAEPYRVMSR